MYVSLPSAFCYTQRPEKGAGLPGPGVADGSELSVGMLRIKPESSGRIVSGLDCWAISLGPQWLLFNIYLERPFEKNFQ